MMGSGGAPTATMLALLAAASLVATEALAQADQPASGAPAAATPAAGERDGSAPPRDVPRRAPLADVEDLEPAVDVSRLSSAQAPAAAGAAGARAGGTASATPDAADAPRTPPAAGASARPSRRVMDTLDLGTTSITGNQELPKVLYIVPWKKSDLGDLVGRPVDTLLDEVLAPVDPEVFERHLQFYESLYGSPEED